MVREDLLSSRAADRHPVREKRIVGDNDGAVDGRQMELPSRKAGRKLGGTA
ncbi:hypothetical protein AB6A23_15920 [Paenibacillus tarimensis]